MATTRAHTPKPWTFDKRSGQVDCDGGTIAHEISWAPNGPLIAAAPELLEVLRVAVAYMTESQGDLPEWALAPVHRGVRKPDRHGIVLAALAAIAKAEGR